MNTATNTQHTPWQVRRLHGKAREIFATDPNGEDCEIKICHVFPTERIPQGSEWIGDTDALSTLITRAVPNHAALVNALEKCLTWAVTYQRQSGTGPDGPLARDIEQARAAIARATGKGGAK